MSITTKDLMAGLSNPARWLTYSGDYAGQRHSPLKQITPANVAQLSAQWTFQTAVTSGFRTQFEATNEGDLVAADSRSGKELWRYQLGHPLYAGPATFMLDNRQYLVAGAGTTLTAFALPR